MSISPTSRVLATWVPPSACVSRPSISTIRIRLHPLGHQVDLGADEVGIRKRLFALQLVYPYRTFFGESLVRQAFDLTDYVGGPLAGKEKSILARSVRIWPPVTFASKLRQITPERTCKAV